jgi:hypothetical protein
MRSIHACTGLFGAALLVLSTPAFADGPKGGITKMECIDANTKAQSLRRDGKLTAARVQLLKCGDPACPPIIRDDCTQRLDDVEKAQPTIVFDGKDGDGHDLVAVSVTIDGQPFADKLDGKPLRVDPGPHSFVFTATGQPPVTKSFVLREGEQGRREQIIVGSPTVQAPAPGAPGTTPPGQSALPSTPPESPSGGLGTQQIIGIAVGGAGVVGLGVGAVFGLLASSAWSSAKSACGGDISHCANVSAANSDKSTTNTDGTISTVGFIAGGVLAAGGAVLFFTGHRAEAEPTASVAVAPTLGPGMGGILVRGSF